MQAWLGGWLRDILVAAMLAAIVEAVAPEGKIKPLVRFASGVLIVAILVQGSLSLVSLPFSELVAVQTSAQPAQRQDYAEAYAAQVRQILGAYPDFEDGEIEVHCNGADVTGITLRLQGAAQIIGDSFGQAGIKETLAGIYNIPEDAITIE
ncbi:stage III sporulation protein AF [Christensenellaceae bacterium NSJ-44]|uniref:Stage III sporulation protein AF n=1 Tax=Luoshenia tenuis TaxID=2763654 RepID=A0A926HLV8_9FIRM|nr:stage III sporulation protein AF [Luoshenia tenuis]MBC8528874.1 stage III sporulation protein AF [Luoshenia tenuis]